MVRLGMVGNVLIHNYPYGAYFNGTDDAVLRERCTKPWMGAFVEGRHPEPAAPEARITHVWAGVRDEADAIAASCRIPNVCASADEVIANTDAVLILDEDVATRTATVERCLKAGKGVFVDKILSASVDKARELVALAQENNVPIAAWSQLLFAAEAAPFRDAEGGAGLVTFCLGKAQLPAYSIHLVCSAMAAFGLDPVEVCRVESASDETPMLVFTYADGKAVMLRAGADLPPRGVVCHVAKGRDPITAQLADMGAMFDGSAAALARLFEQGESVVPAEAIIRMAEAAALLCV